MTAVLWLSAVTSAIYGVVLTRRPPGLLRTVVKTLPVACLALICVWTGGPVLLTLALVFCALGDAFLSRDGSQAFLAGLAAFAVAHLFYIRLLLAESTWPDIGPLLALVTFGTFMAAGLYHRVGEFRWPVMIYIAIIMAMGLAALGHPSRLVLIAAALFIASDSVLSIETFLMREIHPARPVTARVIWFTYWGAQLAFLLAFAP